MSKEAFPMRSKEPTIFRSSCFRVPPDQDSKSKEWVVRRDDTKRGMSAIISGRDGLVMAPRLSLLVMMRLGLFQEGRWIQSLTHRRGR